VNQRFAHAATWIGHVMGSHWTFFAALTVCVVWLISGPVFGFSDTWQLVINTSTTIFTFLLLFIIQNTQNRTDAAVNIKLDELIRAEPEARTDLAIRHLESCSEEELRREQHRIEKLISRTAR
jgi:low affinity Fe/Cu permease